MTLVHQWRKCNYGIGNGKRKLTQSPHSVHVCSLQMTVERIKNCSSNTALSWILSNSRDNGPPKENSLLIQQDSCLGYFSQRICGNEVHSWYNQSVPSNLRNFYSFVIREKPESVGASCTLQQNERKSKTLVCFIQERQQAQPSGLDEQRSRQSEKSWDDEHLWKKWSRKDCHCIDRTIQWHRRIIRSEPICLHSLK